MDPGTATLIAGGLGAVGSALGGGGRDAATAQKDQYTYNKWLRRSYAQDIVYDARKAGIHPLAILGANTAAGSVDAPFGPSGNGSALGGALSSLGQGFQQYAQINANLVDKQLDPMDIQTKNMQFSMLVDQFREYGALVVKRRQDNPNLPGFGTDVWVPHPELQLEGAVPFMMVFSGNPKLIDEMLESGGTPLDPLMKFFGFDPDKMDKMKKIKVRDMLREFRKQLFNRQATNKEDKFWEE